MASCEVLKFKDVEIIYTDVSGCSADESLKLIDQNHNLVSSYSHKSVLSLVNVTGVEVTPALLKRVNENVSRNNPYVIATVVIGLNAFKRILLDTIMAVTGRNIVALESFEEAMVWLHDAKRENLLKEPPLSSDAL